MPQYLAPGVYVEEIAGPRTIQGVSTSVAAFIGPCRTGPTSGRPELLTSYLDFVSIYGDAADLNFTGGTTTPNYLALGAKGFFDEGGSSLYVVRTFLYSSGGLGADHAFADLPDPEPDTDEPDTDEPDTDEPDTDEPDTDEPDTDEPDTDEPDTDEPDTDEPDTDQPDPDTPSDPPAGAAEVSGLTLRARFPGEAGRMLVTFTLKAGGNALVLTESGPTLTRVHEFDTVWAITNPLLDGSVQVVLRDAVTGVWKLGGEAGPTDLTDESKVYPLTVLVEVQRPSVDSHGLPVFGPKISVGEFGFDPRAIGTGISTVLAARPPTRRQELTIPLAMEGVDGLAEGDNAQDALPGALAKAIFGASRLATAPVSTTPLADRQRLVTLAAGVDGGGPTSAEYDGNVSFNDYANDGNPAALAMNGLLALESIEDISIVAAPGASTGWGAGDPAESGRAINNSVTAHCERLLYRVAALDTPQRMLPTEALDYRNFRSSTHAALYYPWVTVGHPIDGRRIDVPPAPYLAGIWARSDNFRGVIKAPANEVLRSALDLETRVNKAQQELLNPEGVNCLRFFPGPGFLVWGARTISDDPEWKYLSIRRYFNYLERSIDQGTQWVVFEINGPALWDAVRHTVEGFLFNEWKNGALLGRAPEEGFFVRCDESTMTAEDLDNGRLICIIGVAAAKPAEFVIFRISQFTATPSS